MNKKSVKDVDVRGIRVFCRVDFNVPLQNGKITDDTRIRAALPTIRHLVEQGAKVVLASHLGRPKGKVVEELRLNPVAERLSEYLKQPVIKVDEVAGPEVEEKVSTLKNGEVLLLENVRFHPGEEKMTRSFPKPSPVSLIYMSMMPSAPLTAPMRPQPEWLNICRPLPGFCCKKKLKR